MTRVTGGLTASKALLCAVALLAANLAATLLGPSNCFLRFLQPKGGMFAGLHDAAVAIPGGAHVNGVELAHSVPVSVAQHCGLAPCCVGTESDMLCWRRPSGQPNGRGRPYQMIFHTNEMSYRGVPGSVYDYAVAFEEYACGVAHYASFDGPSATSYDKVAARFPGRLHFAREAVSTQDMAALVRRHKIDTVYTQQYGLVERTSFAVNESETKLLMHAVFSAAQPHGYGYAAISDVVERSKQHPDVPTVPYIAKLDGAYADAPSLRGDLGIPDNATVICRHGGEPSFNVMEARYALCSFIMERPDAWVLSLGMHRHDCDTRPPRIVYLDASSDMLYKRRFLNSCDACVHARKEGETFGLAVAECSLAGLPVITYKYAPRTADNHLRILGPHAKLYSDSRSLLDILRSFDRVAVRANATLYRGLYAGFTPRSVMLTFLRNFGILDEVIRVSTGGGGACYNASNGAVMPA